MLRVRILLAAVLTVSALAVVAAPAGASAPASKAQFCTAVKNLDRNDGGSLNPSQAKVVYNRFKTAVKYAPSKVKSAGNKILSVLGKLKGITSGNAGDLANFFRSGDYKSYSKAVVTFFTTAETTCAPSITSTTSG